MASRRDSRSIISPFTRRRASREGPVTYMQQRMCQKDTHCMPHCSPQVQHAGMPGSTAAKQQSCKQSQAMQQQHVSIRDL